MKVHLAIVVALSLAAAGCKRGAPANANVDAASSAEPIASVTPVASVAPVVTASAAPSSRLVSFGELAPAPTTVSTARSWTGMYKCQHRLRLTQVGTTVTGYASVGADNKSITCSISAAGNVCTGTEVDIHQGKSSTQKTRKITLRRDTGGTIHYSPEGAAATSCPRL